MDYLDTLLHRNTEFVSQGFNPNLRMMPSSRTFIIGCLDPRVDPMNIFKLEAGEAAIFRNIGGRVTPAVLETIGLLRSISKAFGTKIGPGASLIVLHHTDCGINHIYKDAPDLLARHMGVASEQLDTLAITDPRKSVAVDVAALKADPRVPGAYTVSGLVYDVATGKVETVAPPAILWPEEH
jgi:carbonic anhydrase